MRSPPGTSTPLRSRIDRVEALLQRHEIDVLALQETKAREDQIPLMGLQSLGYDAGGRRHQPVERRRDPQPGRHRGRRSRVPRDARLGRPGRPPRRGRSGRPAAAYGCGRCTCPTAARSTTRTTSTSSTGWPGCARRRRGWLDERRGAGRRLEHRPAGRRRLRHGGLRQGHARDPAGAGGVPGVPRRRLGRRRAPARARARTSSPTGTTTGSGSSGTAACASTSSSARRRSPHG